MKTIHAQTRDEWRSWLAANHGKEDQGIWLVFSKKKKGKTSLTYDEAVEEALCFGWIDSTIRKIDEEKYCRKLTPRRKGSKWSALNKKRVKKLIADKRMTSSGQAKIDESKRLGLWDIDPTPQISFEMPEDLAAALGGSSKALHFFQILSPSERRRYIGWITTAKQATTKAKRIAETIDLLENGKKLGLR
jgi:uncharacterized protein YdeI (YjbR/CyaY-like superfamily)